MRVEIHEVEWLELPSTVPQSELARRCGLSAGQVQELVDYGLLKPVGGSAPEHAFSAACLEPLRQAAILRVRFDLDLFVLGLLYSQLERIGQLERQVRSLEANLPHGAVDREGPALWREPHG